MELLVLSAKGADGACFASTRGMVCMANEQSRLGAAILRASISDAGLCLGILNGFRGHHNACVYGACVAHTARHRLE